MNDRDVAAAVQRFNAGRDPDRLERKFAGMRESPFAFFRATAHLFYDDLPAASVLDDGPAAWISGDLHLENFGSYRGDNGLAYFDLNDFDEGALASPVLEVTRFLTSVYLAAHALGLGSADASSLSETFLAAYSAALCDGKARWVERATATGMVRRLLRSAQRRLQLSLLEERTKGSGKARRLRVDGRHALPISGDRWESVAKALAKVAAREDEPRFFEVLDVARRFAGLGSLGVERYVVLVRGDGSRNGHRLLDLKQARASVLGSRPQVRQPDWACEAERVTTLQHRLQAIAPARLRAVPLAPSKRAAAAIGVDRSFILRELQPTEDRLALAHANGKIKRLRSVMRTMGHLSAWSQLRGASRNGAAGIDALSAFGAQKEWQRAAMSYAKQYQAQVIRDWRKFSRAAPTPRSGAPPSA
jgi:uncharacterized protein (DUF2252 family)